MLGEVVGQLLVFKIAVLEHYSAQLGPKKENDTWTSKHPRRPQTPIDSRVRVVFLPQHSTFELQLGISSFGGNLGSLVVELLFTAAASTSMLPSKVDKGTRDRL